MASITAKLLEAIKNLRPDAKPKPPRPETNDVTGEGQDNERGETFIEEEEILNGSENIENNNSTPTNKIPKNKNNTFTNVNTQATGNVINIVKSPGFRWGDNHVYYLGPAEAFKHAKGGVKAENPDDDVKETFEIEFVKKATITPDHKYIDFVSKNLGKNWHRFFQKLGYLKGRIETFEMDEIEAGNSISEARYKLLLDWVRNNDDATLGHLATLLWAEGEKHIVKELASIYSKKEKVSK